MATEREPALAVLTASLFGASETPPLNDSRVVLASFQRDGYEHARATPDRHHGVTYVDGAPTLTLNHIGGL